MAAGRSGRLAALLALATLTGCTAYPAAAPVDSEERIRQELAGRVAGEPLKCLPTDRTRDIAAGGEDAIYFREGERIWVNRVQGYGCDRLRWSDYALVTTSLSPGYLCRGDLAKVTDLANGLVVGSCALGDFVPYTRP